MIILGPGGNCASSTIESLERLKKIGLGSQEIEFVYGIYIDNKEAEKIGEITEKLGIKLSIHAPYYVNLTSLKKDVVEKSRRWILSCCERGHYLRAENIVFHPGFYHGRDKEEVFEIVKGEIKGLMEEVKKRKWKVKLAPETTGKKSAFGDLDEIVRLVKEVKCSFCVDFAHLYARNNGRIDYEKVLNKVNPVVKGIMHCHFSGIEFGEKGEKKHLNIDSEKPSFKKLAKVLLKRKMDVNIICESPRQYLDSLDMKDIVEGLKNG